jgi:hypothetical protein
VVLAKQNESWEKITGTPRGSGKVDQVVKGKKKGPALRLALRII